MENKKPRSCKDGSQVEKTNLKIAKKQEWRAKDGHRVRVAANAVMKIIENSTNEMESYTLRTLRVDSVAEAKAVILVQLGKVIPVRLDKLVIKKVASQNTEESGDEWTVVPFSQSSMNSQMDIGSIGRRRKKVYWEEDSFVPKCWPSSTQCSNTDLDCGDVESEISLPYFYGIENIPRSKHSNLEGDLNVQKSKLPSTSDTVKGASKDSSPHFMEIEEVPGRKKPKVNLDANLNAQIALLSSNLNSSLNLDSIDASKDSPTNLMEIEEVPSRKEPAVYLEASLKVHKTSISSNLDINQNLDSIEVASEDFMEISCGSLESQDSSEHEDYPPKSEILEIFTQLNADFENSVSNFIENTPSKSDCFLSNNAIQNNPIVYSPSIINTCENPASECLLMGVFYPAELTTASSSALVLKPPGALQTPAIVSAQHSDDFLQDLRRSETFNNENCQDCCIDAPQSPEWEELDSPVSKSFAGSDEQMENYPLANEILKIILSLG